MGWGGEEGCSGESWGEQSEGSVSTAPSQGAGPYNHSASHPVGGSEMRERAPSSLVPERQTALQTQIPIQTILRVRLFPATPEVEPFLQITCAWSAPKSATLDKFAKRDSLSPAGEPHRDSYRLLGRNSPSIRRETVARDTLTG